MLINFFKRVDPTIVTNSFKNLLKESEEKTGKQALPVINISLEHNSILIIFGH